jgi:hypothetical protein
LITDAGFKPAEIDELTLDQVEDLFAYWRKYPPLRDLVAAFVGFKPQDRPEEKPKYMSADDMRRMMALTGGKLPGVRPR